MIDRYYTPRWVVEQAFGVFMPNLFPLKPPRTIIEPSAGEGVFIDVARSRWGINPTIIANDSDETVGPWGSATFGYNFDYLGYVGLNPYASRDEVSHSLVITNPPFSLAREFIEKSLTVADTVVFLLKMDFLGTAGRVGFFEKYPPSYIGIIPHRPSFTGPDVKKKGSDQYNYAWFIWDKNYKAAPKLFWLPTIPKELRK